LQTIEALYPARLVEHVERLAHHAFLGEVWDKAVIYLRQAGSKASAHSAYRDAVSSFERALEALSHLQQSRETLEQVVDLRLDLRGSLFPLGQSKAMLDHLQEAERLAKSLEDQRRTAWASVYLSECLRLIGDLNSAQRFAQTACAIAATLDEFPLQTAATFYLGTSHMSSGDFRRGADLFRKIAQRLEGARIGERCRLAGFPAVMARAYLAWTLAELGEFDEGTSCGVEGLRIAEALDHPFSLALACWGLAQLHTVRGEHDQAIALAERGLALCRDWSLTMVSPVLTRIAGYARVLSGRAVEGVAVLRQAVTAHEAAGRYVAPRVLGELGEALLLAEQLRDADAFAARALALARKQGGRDAEAWLLRLIGEIASRSEHHDIETAGSHYQRALAVAQEMGMRPLVAHCHLGLGKLYRRTDQRDQTQVHLATATTMYRQMGMTYWLEKAEAETTESGR
jgi:tetratricopeptide (TPR) repeat protein